MKHYNIFISHSWKYSNQYEGVIKLLDNRRYFSFTDYSIPYTDPIHNTENTEELYQAFYNKMQSCHIVIVMAGIYSSYSRSIKAEIDIALKWFNLPKPIIAIKPLGATQIPKIIQDNNIEVVNWRTESIVDAIRRNGL